MYMQPEGSDRHSSVISFETQEEDISSKDKKGKFKKMAKKLYPRKAIGGAKVLGGAIRHPMVTTRKVNTFVRRNKNSKLGGGDDGMIREESPEWPLTEDLPPLTRSQTVTELNTLGDTAEEGQ